MAASDLDAGSLQRRGHHLADRYFGDVQKPRDPHLAGAVAAELPDTDPLAAIGDKTLIQKTPLLPAVLAEQPQPHFHGHLPQANHADRESASRPAQQARRDV